jgi:exodeoxyribonuclease III
MKLVTWNCQGAFRKKFSSIAAIKPDLAVIQECEHPDRIKWGTDYPKPSSVLWFGEKPTKGLGVFSWTEVEIHPLDNRDESIRHCVPICVEGKTRFNLIAVWAMDHPETVLSYIAQVNLALIHYHEFIIAEDTVMMGDFNSNQKFAHRPRLASHDWVVHSLADLEMVSAYHLFYLEKHGKETRPTFYMARNVKRPFHIDYIFIPRRWQRRLAKVTVGKPETWLENSDHCPVLVEINEPQ